ncbi:hypothetical protein CHS0354_013960 [Potamilus streckersoni]|uniref:C2H2-type domain-containing protein n=1 Tax=Potamilus streckersoni TaxID=2493646 RepID=A0AAE0RWN6_9BIVA|nr:hypothetical protein CHS0354_013960 [Potamilus streckersoni]
MPPKKPARAVVISPVDYILPCEWNQCQEVHVDMDNFLAHITQHIVDYLSEKNQFDEEEEYICKWRDCGSAVEGQGSGYQRHIYFHAFHVKIKCIGRLLIEKTNGNSCRLDPQNGNLVPELPERLQCGWQLCEALYENAEIFYRHVEYHADSYPEGNNVKNGCACQWEGCETKVKSKHKLKEHLRSHTQEKIVACPTCGGLFSNRTKFFDHLRRQEDIQMQLYQCSHCSKRFATEKLLRDHMRHHVNQYKCPYCEMTCSAPSCLKMHIKYRHSKERPFKCDYCEYSCKALADLKKHFETHNVESQFSCQEQGCSYISRGYHSLANHFKRVHQDLSVANYACHVCNAMFTRGGVLTKHLKKKHKFHWPSGHSRFRYKLHDDGIWRLQTVRYESVKLASHGDKDIGDKQKDVTDDLNGDSTNADASGLSAKNTENMDDSSAGENSAVNTSDDTDQINEYMDTDEIPDSQIQISQNDQLSVAGTNVTIVTDSEGANHVIISPDQSNEVNGQRIEVYEDNMAYNLQMLGEVALLGPNR